MLNACCQSHHFKTDVYMYNVLIKQIRILLVIVHAQNNKILQSYTRHVHYCMVKVKEVEECTINTWIFVPDKYWRLLMVLRHLSIRPIGSVRNSDDLILSR